jgi:hypothetical protein
MTNMLLKAKTILKLYQGVFHIFHEGFSLIIMSVCVCVCVCVAKYQSYWCMQCTLQIVGGAHAI